MKIEHSVFDGNAADNGAAISNTSPQFSLTNSAFYANTAGNGGGTVHSQADGSNPTILIANNIFAHNTSADVLHLTNFATDPYHLYCTNNTLAYNKADETTSNNARQYSLITVSVGTEMSSGSTSYFANNIFWGNKSTFDNTYSINDNISPYYIYNNASDMTLFSDKIQYSTPKDYKESGAMVLASDPFVSASGSDIGSYDWRYTDNSLFADRGNTISGVTMPATDYVGSSRISRKLDVGPLEVGALYDPVNALTLDGQSGYASFEGTAYREFAFSAWIYIDDLPHAGTTAMIFSHDPESGYLGFALNSNGGLICHYGANNQSVPYAYPPVGSWFHLGIKSTINDQNNDLSIFINGIEKSKASYANITSSTGTFYLGAMKYDGKLSNFLKGKIDEVSYYAVNDATPLPDFSLLMRTPVAAIREQYDANSQPQLIFSHTLDDGAGINPSVTGASFEKSAALIQPIGLSARISKTSVTGPLEDIVVQNSLEQKPVYQIQLSETTDFSNPIKDLKDVKYSASGYSLDGIKQYKNYKLRLRAEFADNIVSDWVYADADMNSPGNAAVFDGTGQYLKTDENIELSGGFTLALWMKPSSAGMVAGTSSTGISIAEQGDTLALIVSLGGTPYTIPARIPRDEWMHVAVSYTAGLCTVYCNGIQVYEVNNTQSLISAPLYVGGSETSAIYAGAVDELILWNEPLIRDTLVWYMLTQRMPAHLPGIVAYYPFDENLTGGFANKTGKNIGPLKLSASPASTTMSSAVIFPINVAFRDANARSVALHYAVPQACTATLEYSLSSNFDNSVTIKIEHSEPDSRRIGNLMPNATYYTRLRNTSDDGYVSEWKQMGFKTVKPTERALKLSSDVTKAVLDSTSCGYFSKVKTVSLWVKTEESTANGEAVILKDAYGTFAIKYEPATQKFAFTCNNTERIESAAYSYGWHHLAWVLHGSTLMAYIDGLQIDSTSVSSRVNVQNTSGSTTLGPLGEGCSMYIDELSFWSDALNMESIRGIMYRPLGSADLDDGLLAYYDCNSHPVSTELEEFFGETNKFGTLSDVTSGATEDNYVPSEAKFVPFVHKASFIDKNTLSVAWGSIAGGEYSLDYQTKVGANTVKDTKYSTNTAEIKIEFPEGKDTLIINVSATVDGESFPPSEYALPTTYTVADKILCSGSSTELSVDELADASYQWFGPNGKLNDETSRATTVSASGTYYCLTTKSSGGQDIALFNISIPAVDVAIAGNTTICAGAKMELNSVNKFQTYKWTVNENEQGAEGTLAYMASDKDTIQLTVTTEEGCTATKAVTATVWPAPVVSLAKEYTIESGQTANISAIAAEGATYSYEWKLGGDIVSTEAQFTTPALNADAEYNLTITDASSQCSTEYITKVKVATVIVKASSIQVAGSVGMEIAAQYKLNALVLPADATDKNLEWTSSNPAVATVNQEGLLTGIAPGIAEITVTNVQKTVSATVLVSVTESPIAVTSVELPDSIVVAVSTGTYKLTPIIRPFNATIGQYVWTTTGENISIDQSTGVVTITSTGTAQISLNISGKTASTIFIVRNTEAPTQIKALPDLVIASGTDMKKFNLGAYFSDETNISDLRLKVVGNDAITVMNDNGTAVLSGMQAIDDTVSFTLLVTDEEGNTISVPVTLYLKVATENAAPQLATVTEQTPSSDGSFSPVRLDHLVSDDFTMPEDMVWEVNPTGSLTASISDGVLTVTAPDGWTGQDTIVLTATDEAGTATAIKIAYSSKSQQENQAPFILPIPDQTRTASTDFAPIYLSRYVSDDNTSTDAIVWYTSPTSKLNVQITKGIAHLSIADKSWIGTERISFSAVDSQGEVSGYTVTFTQLRTPEIVIEGTFQVSFTAVRTVAAPGAPITITADVKGAQYWKWLVDGVAPADSANLNPNIAIGEIGTHDISLVVSDGNRTDTLTKKEYITIVGISQPDTLICLGQSITLTASDTRFGQYLWDKADAGTSYTIAPRVSGYHSLRISDVFFAYLDSIYISVSQPVELPADTSLCTGDSLLLSAHGYVSYEWSDGFTGATRYVQHTGKYIVSATDNNGCSSADSTTIEQLYSLPAVSLGTDTVYCAGETIGIDAGEAEAYIWSTGENSREILVDTTGYYAVTATDKNGCRGSDTVAYRFLYPYKEELALATFSEDSKSIIAVWERTPGQRTERYELWRESGGPGNYVKIADRAYADSLYYVDTDANALQQAYRYKLVTIDSVCGASAHSDPHKTMILSTGRGLEDNIANLSWNPYQGIDIDEYRVYKIAQSDTVFIGSVVADGSPEYKFNYYEHKKGTVYRVLFNIGRTVQLSSLKSDSGPFSQSMSNLSEAILLAADSVYMTAVSIAPIPAENVCQIRYPASESEIVLYIHHLSGQLAAQFVLSSGGNDRIDISQLPAGSYSCSMIVDDKQYRLQILKQ